MLQHETLVEGAPKKAGVRCVAANGAKNGQLRRKARAFQEGWAARQQQLCSRSQTLGSFWLQLHGFWTEGIPLYFPDDLTDGAG